MDLGVILPSNAEVFYTFSRTHERKQMLSAIFYIHLLGRETYCAPAITANADAIRLQFHVFLTMHAIARPHELRG